MFSPDLGEECDVGSSTTDTFCDTTCSSRSGYYCKTIPADYSSNLLQFEQYLCLNKCNDGILLDSPRVENCD